MLEIRNLHASVGGKEILRGIDLTVNAGEVHAVMGPNGSGKSTLAHVLAGREAYVVTAGKVIYEGKDLLAMSPEDRAREGIFLAFQYPVEIPGVSTTYFLKAGVNAIRKHRGLEELDAIEFLAMVKEKMKLVEMDQALINRPLNEGFSGGEKKRNEIFQMGVLDPKLAILDETDSGLDIDALKIVAKGVNAFRSPHRAMLVITHYQRLLNYIVPDFVHVLVDGRIVKSGGKRWPGNSKRRATTGSRPTPRWRRRRARDGKAVAMIHVAQELAGISRTLSSSRRTARQEPHPGSTSSAQRGSPASQSSAFPRRGTRSGSTPPWLRSRRSPSRGLDMGGQYSQYSRPGPSSASASGSRRCPTRVRERSLLGGVLVAPGLPGGVRMESLASALAADSEGIEPHLARYARYEDHAFVALNTAFLEDGALLYVPAGEVVGDPIHLLFISTAPGTATASHPGI
jgi:Fe-S cluster assembly ATP-binding protein